MSDAHDVLKARKHFMDPYTYNAVLRAIRALEALAHANKEEWGKEFARAEKAEARVKDLDRQLADFKLSHATIDAQREKAEAGLAEQLKQNGWLLQAFEKAEAALAEAREEIELCGGGIHYRTIQRFKRAAGRESGEVSQSGRGVGFGSVSQPTKSDLAAAKSAARSANTSQGMTGGEARTAGVPVGDLAAAAKSAAGVLVWATEACQHLSAPGYREAVEEVEPGRFRLVDGCVVAAKITAPLKSGETAKSAARRSVETDDIGIPCARHFVKDCPVCHPGTQPTTVGGRVLEKRRYDVVDHAAKSAARCDGWFQGSEREGRCCLPTGHEGKHAGFSDVSAVHTVRPLGVD